MTDLCSHCWPLAADFLLIAIPNVKLTVNGNQRDLADGATVTALLEALDLGGKFVAVEVNKELVPKARHEEHVLADGDRVEVVTLVGGG